MSCFPRCGAIRGFRGAEVLRRPEAGSVAFVILTRFESLEDVQAFAGANWDRPVIEPRAARLLTRCDQHATHYETSLFGP